MKYSKYFVVFIAFMFASQANSLVYPVPILFQTVLSFLLIIVSIEIYRYPLKLVLYPVGILTVLHLLHSLIFGNFVFGLLSNFIFGISIVLFLKNDLIFIYLKVLKYLALISIIFSLFLIVNFHTTYNILHVIQNILGIQAGAQHDGIYYSNIFIYTINQTNNFRNCGFMWEPGAFACLLVTGIFFELILSKFKITKTNIIFMIAFLSTFSTTGLICLPFLGFFYLTNKVEKLSLGSIIPIFVIIVIVFFSFPSNLNKVQKLINTNFGKMATRIANADYGSYGETLSLGRFDGFLFNLIDLRRSPIIGIGSSDNTSAKAKYIDAVSINGLGNLLSRYGLLGFSLYLYALIMFSIHIKEKYKLKRSYNFIIIFLIQSFGFGILFSALYIAIPFLYLIKINNKIQNKIILKYLPNLIVRNSLSDNV